MTNEEAQKLKNGDVIARKSNPSERYIVVDSERYQISGPNGAGSCILVRLEQWPMPLTDKFYFVNPKFYDLVIDSTGIKIMKQATEEEVITLLE